MAVAAMTAVGGCAAQAGFIVRVRRFAEGTAGSKKLITIYSNLAQH
jgi:hypothetical protein